MTKPAKIFMRTVNLLPKIRQQELRYESILHSLRTVVTLTLISFAIVFLAQISTKYYLEAQSGVIKAEIADLQKQVDKKENAEIKNKIKKINDLIADYQNLVDSSPKWSNVIKAFVTLPPEGIKITSFGMDINKKTISITGKGVNREAVIQLYNNILQDSKNFYNINYPLENIVRPTDVSFHFSFNIRDTLLK